jgi:hypothetical protein
LTLEHKLIQQARQLPLPAINPPLPTLTFPARLYRYESNHVVNYNQRQNIITSILYRLRIPGQLTGQRAVTAHIYPIQAAQFNSGKDVEGKPVSGVADFLDQVELSRKWLKYVKPEWQQVGSGILGLRTAINKEVSLGQARLTVPKWYSVNVFSDELSSVKPDLQGVSMADPSGSLHLHVNTKEGMHIFPDVKHHLAEVMPPLGRMTKREHKPS